MKWIPSKYFNHIPTHIVSSLPLTLRNCHQKVDCLMCNCPLILFINILSLNLCQNKKIRWINTLTLLLKNAQSQKKKHIVNDLILLSSFILKWHAIENHESIK
jgi:hypothetical protein